MYWYERISHGYGDFVHLFCDDGDLVDTMRANGLKRVLCVGNGISQEPRALAWAGFDVTALDLSPYATKVASEVTPPAELLAQLVGGRSGGLNGNLNFVAGNLCDPACCPGPYDVVIERLTLQLYSDEYKPRALQAVANRITSLGIFFSQSHDWPLETTRAAYTLERVVVPRTRLAHLAHGRPIDDASSLVAHNYWLVMDCIAPS